MRLYYNDIINTDLSITQRAVWTTLLNHANKNFECFPSLKTIATECNLGLTAVKNAIKVLAQKCLIRIKNRFDKETGAKTSNLYTLIDKKFWKVKRFKKKKTEYIEIEKDFGTEIEDINIVANVPVDNTIEHDSIVVDNIDSKAEVCPSEEQIKEQIGYENVSSRDGRYKDILDCIVRHIRKNPVKFTELNESMSYHICKKYVEIPTKIGNMESYIETMMINQPSREMQDCLNDQKDRRNTLASPNNRFHNFKQGTYDYDELDAKILNRDIAQVNSNDFDENDILSMFSHDMPF